MGLLTKLKYLERLNESPKKDSDCISLSEKFDQPGCTKQTQKTNIDEVFLNTQDN
jgi:hypothetical protein